MHVAASFDGEKSGRFGNETCIPDPPMRWWKPGNTRFDRWKTGNSKDLTWLATTEGWECCYTDCKAYQAALCVVVQFVNAVSVAILEMGRGDQWPQTYLK
jgi:hypothetical protein